MCDVEGADLEDLTAAKSYAVTYIADALSLRAQDFWDSETYEATVTDDYGLTLFLVTMSSATATASAGKAAISRA